MIHPQRAAVTQRTRKNTKGEAFQEMIHPERSAVFHKEQVRRQEVLAIPKIAIMKEKASLLNGSNVVAPVTGIICFVALSLTGRPVDKRALITVTRYKHTACQSKTATTPVTLLSRKDRLEERREREKEEGDELHSPSKTGKKKRKKENLTCFQPYSSPRSRFW